MHFTDVAVICSTIMGARAMSPGWAAVGSLSWTLAMVLWFVLEK